VSDAAAGDTERPRLASSWADLYLAEGISTVAASIAPAMQFFKTGTQAVQRRPGPREAPIYRNWKVIRTH
jgi:hypothetical protein